MEASKSGFMKDALILFAITLIAGICLGFVYDLTKKPIEEGVIAANNATYRQVLPEAAEFSDVEGSKEQLAVFKASGELTGLGFGNVALESVLEGKSEDGAVVGHVINALSNDSYGGAVKLSIGFDASGAITGVGIREINDTPGLGLKAKEPSYLDQFVGKDAEFLTVTKSGNAAENEINAISGATITSAATTNAVNAAIYYLNQYIN